MLTIAATGSVLQYSRSPHQVLMLSSQHPCFVFRINNGLHLIRVIAVVVVAVPWIYDPDTSVFAGPRKRLDAFLRRSADTSTSNSNDVIGDSAAAVVPRAPSGGVEVLPQIPTQQVQLDSIAPSNSNSAQPEEKEENGGSGGGADNKTTSLRLDPADALFGKFDRNSFLRIREELRSPAGAGGDRQPPQQLPEQMTALQRFEEELLKLSLGQILGEAGGAAAAAPLTSSPAAGANSAFSTDGGPAAVAEAHVVAQRGGWDLLEKDGDPREVPQPLAKKWVA